MWIIRGLSRAMWQVNDPAGGPATGTPTSDQPTVTVESLQVELEKTAKALAKANADALKHRLASKDHGTQLEELKAAMSRDKEEAERAKMIRKERESADRAALEKTRTESEQALTATQARLRDTATSYEVKLQALKLGIIDPDAASVLMDRSQLHYDDDGQPMNVEELLVKLLADKPYLAAPQGKPSPTAGASVSPSRGTTSMAPLSYEVISKMNSQTYEARRAEILQFYENDRSFKRH